MQPDKDEQTRLDERIAAITEGVIEGITREVARRRREGLPIYVWRDGTVVDLQTIEEGEDQV